MQIALTAAVVGLVLSIVSIFLKRERSWYVSVGSVYGMEKTLVYVCVCVAVAMILLAIILLILAAYYGGRHGRDAEIPACIGAAAALCALIWSIYQVRVEDVCIRFGLSARQSLLYSEIKEIRDIRNQGSPRAVLVAASGREHNLWSNLLGYEQLMDNLKKKCPTASYRVIGQ